MISRVTWRPPARAVAPETGGNRRSGHPGGAGFTLIELLICLGIVMIVMGLALPAFAAARERARAQKSASNVRQLGQAVLVYCGDQDGFYPIGEQGRAYSISMDGEFPRQSFAHFEFSYAWPVLLRAYAPWDANWQLWYSPGRRVRPPSGGRFVPAWPSYEYSQSFLAKGPLWVQGRVPEDGLKRLLAGNRDHEVLFPSEKVMMWDGELAYLLRQRPWLGGMLGNPAPMLFADHHVAELSPSDATPGVVNVLNMGHGARPLPLHNTPMGVQGRDY